MESFFSSLCDRARRRQMLDTHYATVPSGPTKTSDVKVNNSCTVVTQGTRSAVYFFDESKRQRFCFLLLRRAMRDRS